MLRKAVRRIIYTVLWVLYPLTFIIPRSKRIWVFGGGLDRYADNAKYLFEYVSNHEKDVDTYWISGKRDVVMHVRSMGLKALWRYSLKGMWICLRAKVYVYSSYVIDINMWVNRGALKLNLWHALGFIAVESDIVKGPLRRLYNPKNLFEKVYSILHSPHIWIRSFYLVAPSKLIAENYARSFQLPKEKMVKAGYPRLAPLYEKTEKPEKWKAYSNIVIYMPTKRLYDMDGYLEKAIPDPEKLNSVCAANDMLFVFKLHPMTSEKALERFKGYSYLEVMDKKTDVYPLLNHTSGLITDYSSIHADYVVLKKPLLFYTIDLEEYLQREATFTMDYSWITNKKYLSTPKELFEALGKLSNYNQESQRLNDLYWEKDSRTASKDLTAWIKSRIN